MTYRAAHLKHGIRRVVVLDIDLHHGMYIDIAMSDLSDAVNRQWNAVYRLADK